MACMETPSRPAVSRSTLTKARKPPSWASETISRNMSATAQLLDQACRPTAQPPRSCCRPTCTGTVRDWARAHLHVLHRLEVHRHARHGRDRPLEARDDRRDVRLALVARLEGDLQVAGVGRGVERAHAHHRDHAFHVGVLGRLLADVALQPLHLGERHLGAGLHDSCDEPGVLQRQKALGDEEIEADGEKQRGEGHDERGALAAQHPEEARVIAADDEVHGTG